MKKIIFLAIPIGLCLGLGIYTFQYGKGYSYFKNDPVACMNCHIMQDQFNQWMKSSHKAVASCNDCHLPHTFPMKFIAKGMNGFNHGWAFSTGRFHEPLKIKKMNAKILQNSCLFCHGDFVAAIHPQNTNLNNSLSCVKCHQSVGHGGRS